MDTVYRERANGRWEYWTYSDGDRHFVSESWANRQSERGAVRIVQVGEKTLRRSPSRWRFAELGIRL